MLDLNVPTQELQCDVKYCLGSFSDGSFVATDEAKCGATNPTCAFEDSIVRNYLW